MAAIWNGYAKNGVKLQCHEKQDRQLSACCEKVWRWGEYSESMPAFIKIEDINFPEEELIKKWANYCTKQCSFPVTIEKGEKGVTAVFKLSDYDNNLVKLFLGFTIFRYVIERKKVVIKTFAVREEMPKLDPIRALEMALIMEKVNDGHRGLFYTDSSLPILINKKYIKREWRNGMDDAEEINKLFKEREGTGSVATAHSFKTAKELYKYMNKNGNLYKEDE